MALPARPLPESSVEVNGERVEFRSLSRAEAITLTGFTGKESDAEVFMVCAATGATKAEAEAFFQSTSTVEAGKLVTAIAIFSGIASQKTIDAARERGEVEDAPDPK